MSAPALDLVVLIDQIADIVAEKVAARLGGGAATEPPDDLPENADSKQAAAYLGLAEQTLRIMRLRGSGPEFFKHGRLVRYPRSDLRSYRAKRMRRHTKPKP